MLQQHRKPSTAFLGIYTNRLTVAQFEAAAVLVRQKGAFRNSLYGSKIQVSIRCATYTPAFR